MAVDACVLTVTVDRDAAQITLQGSPTGAAGGASLTPVPGVELIFDRAGGWLSQAIVAIGQPGGPMEPAGVAADYIDGMFGPGTAALAGSATDHGDAHVAIQAPPRVIAALSRLARLHAAWRTSPEPSSPLWAAEATELSGQAGLPGQVGSAAVAKPGGQSGVAVHRDGAAALISRDESRSEVPGELPATAQPELRRRPHDEPPDGWLDLGLVPAGVFRPGLWPDTDFSIRALRAGGPTARSAEIKVEAAILTDAPPDVLVACRARLVDPDARRVLSVAPFLQVKCGRARAELCQNDGPAGACVDVVDDSRRPVHGTRLRLMRQALRWADAALRAEGRPSGLAPELSGERWTRLAELAWDRCRAGWAAAGDPVRADLAAARGATLGDAPGSTLACLARPFLAELACGTIRDRRGRSG